MKYIELINESIQKMANKPSEGAIATAQSIAKEMDDALASSYEIELMYLPIQNSETVDVFNVTNKPSFVCRFYDGDMMKEVFGILNGVDMNKTEGYQFQEIVAVCAGIIGQGNPSISQGD